VIVFEKTAFLSLRIGTVYERPKLSGTFFYFCYVFNVLNFLGGTFFYLCSEEILCVTDDSSTACVDHFAPPPS